MGDMKTIQGMSRCTKLCMLCMLFVVISETHSPESGLVIYANIDNKQINEIDERYLSVCLDTGVLENKWAGLDFGSRKLQTLAHGLSPAYLRFGGTAADYVIFQSHSEWYKSPPSGPINMTKEDVRSLYTFAESVGWRLLLDLNALLRNGTEWDPTNPLELLEFMAEEGMTDNLDLELGNEPNSFKHTANISISATQLGEDFLTLRNAVRTLPSLQQACEQCHLVGPDVTRPRQSSGISSSKDLGVDSADYLKDYLLTVRDAVDAVTWHQYYIDGRTATLSNFTSPEVLDYLLQQIQIMQNSAAEAGHGDYPMWLGETGSAYGGGAPGLSDTYAAGFMWLDKLGVSSREGLEVVMRQSFYNGHYALLDKNTYEPRPDYWLSLLYKQLVGERVLNITLDGKFSRVRLYAHCTSRRSLYPLGSVIVYGMNLYDEEVNVTLTGGGEILTASYIDKYLLSPHNKLTSKVVKLNGKKLLMVNNDTLPELTPERLSASSHVHFPGYTFGFYVLSGTSFKPCLHS